MITTLHVIVLIVFVAVIALIALAALVFFMFPADDDHQDPYADEFPGLYAPRECDRG